MYSPFPPGITTASKTTETEIIQKRIAKELIKQSTAVGWMITIIECVRFWWMGFEFDAGIVWISNCSTNCIDICMYISGWMMNRCYMNKLWKLAIFYLRAIFASSAFLKRKGNLFTIRIPNGSRSLGGPTVKSSTCSSARREAGNICRWCSNGQKLADEPNKPCGHVWNPSSKCGR